MSNLTSTAPAAFDTLLSLLTTAAAAYTTPTTVFDSEIVQYEPSSYVLLNGMIENHSYEWASLGNFAFYETYDISGYVSVFQGNVDPKTVRDATYALYQTVVQTTVIQNSGTWQATLHTVLSPDLTAAGLNWIIPKYARFDSQPGAAPNGGPEGFVGKVDFAYSLHARITV